LIDHHNLQIVSFTTNIRIANVVSNDTISGWPSLC
jgi:hypothetical protein